MSVLDRFRRAAPEPEAPAAAPEPETRESGPFTDARVQQIILQAGGKAAASVNATAALETAASAYGRAFAGARVTPSGRLTSWLTPDVLNLCARQLIRDGELVGRLTVERGRVAFYPAATWDIRGESSRSTWLYRLDESSPSGSTRTETAGADSVLHIRYAFSPDAPWRGLSPVHVASSTGRLHAETETALADESAGARGSVIPTPKDGADPGLVKLRATIANLAGRLALVETTKAWQDDQATAPSHDWRQQRIGATPPDSLRSLRTDSAKAILGACGVPIELFAGGEGSSQREAFRRFLHASVLPLAAICEAELSAALGVDVSLDFQSLRASDIASKARAFAQLVKSGMAVNEAAGLAGLLAED